MGSKSVVIATLAIVAVGIFVPTYTAPAASVSCRLQKCMAVCKSDNREGDDCSGMCRRIISVCKDIVAQERKKTKSSDVTRSSRSTLID